MFVFKYYIRFLCVYIYFDKRWRNESYNDNFISILKFHMILFLLWYTIEYFSGYKLNHELLLLLLSSLLFPSILIYMFNQPHFKKQYSITYKFLRNLSFSSKKKWSTVLMIFIVLGFGCNSKIKPESLNHYFNSRIGWEYQVPNGWNIIEHEEVFDLSKKGDSLANNSVYIEGDVEVNSSKNTIVLALEKDPKNKFIVQVGDIDSTCTNLVTDFSLDKNIFFATVLNNNFYVSDTSSGNISVGENDFLYYKVEFSPDMDSKYSLMELSSCVNFYSFNVTLVYDNDANKEELFDILKESKFERRN